jgi:hypothetical protein
VQSQFYDPITPWVWKRYFASVTNRLL